MKQSNNSSRFSQLSSTSSLAQFLSLHDDKHRSGFITRLDRSPVSAKVTTFITALAVNIIILLFIVCVTMLSFLREYIIQPLPIGSRIFVWAVQNIVIAAAITILLRSTSIPFFFGECRLRLLYGFHPSELIIRRSPRATAALSVYVNRKSCTTDSENQQVEHQWRTAIRAINPRLLYSTTSAMLSSEYWTLEYSAVFDALRRIAAGEIEEEDLEFSIWKQNSDNVWTVCELWRMHEIMSDQHEVTMFKSFLTQSGRQDLLNIWEDMSSEKAVKRKSYQAMVAQFAEGGLDYETVWSHISDRT